tara:strand:+ start:170 stop:361 length:192 start_codon:yes stop_codon:yes gene_type:complete
MSKATIAKITLVINFLMMTLMVISFLLFGNLAIAFFSVAVFVISVVWAVDALESDAMEKSERK